jgi:hypothetical protein
MIREKTRQDRKENNLKEVQLNATLYIHPVESMMALDMLNTLIRRGFCLQEK